MTDLTASDKGTIQRLRVDLQAALLRAERAERERDEWRDQAEDDQRAAKRDRALANRYEAALRELLDIIGDQPASPAVRRARAALGEGTPWCCTVAVDGKRPGPRPDPYPHASACILSSERGADGGGFDLLAHLRRQREWSGRTFGPGSRTAGVIDHIRKELREIEAAPSDLSEWIDVVILAFDGAWRAGGTPEGIIFALVAKTAKNEARQWPDWRTAPADKAIEHVRAPASPRGEQTPPSPGGEKP